MKLITLSEAKETGGKLPSQFQFGDYVQVNLESYAGEGDLWVGGWVVGVHYSVSQVHYDIAIQIGQSNYCQVIEGVRTFMRRVSDGAATSFIDVSQLDIDNLGLEKE